MTPNPVIVAVDEGHFATVVKGRSICRADAEVFPCAAILTARQRLRERAAHLAVATAAREARIT